MARTTIRTDDVTDSEITTEKMATDPTDATNLASGTVATARLGSGTASTDTFLRGDNTWQVVETDTSGIEDDIALLGFRVAANGSLAKYNLVDQTIDDFQDTSGVDSGASSDATRNSAGKYYSGVGTAPGNATGGTITSWSDGGTDYKTHTFTSNGDFVAPSSNNVDGMLVGGGGGGANAQAGGGGGGGMITLAAFPVTAQTYSMVIGAGGLGANTTGNVGGSTTGFGETATGGGGGGFTPPSSGASGGGAGQGGTGATGTVPSVVASQATGFGGYSGGNGPDPSGGGGGGLTQVGENAVSYGYGGDGGNGKQYNLDGNNYYWGGGGGGAVYGAIVSGDGGIGGGGAGGFDSGSSGSSGAVGGSAINSGALGGSPTRGGNGGANSGGGGGGGWYSTTHGAGGSGIVQVRYVADSFSVSAAEDMILVSTATTAESTPTKGDIVFTYSNGAGTTTIGTDLTAEFSADNGSTWTAMTLADQGSTGSQNIVTAHDVALTSTSGTSMRYRIKTMNQSASKDTRIHAVSLGWS